MNGRLPEEALWWVLAALGGGLALVQTVRLWWRGASVRWRLGRRLRRAMDGEARAEAMLERAGYAVVGRQVAGAMAVLVDGREVEVAVRADYVVERRGRRFVAEVKTGARAPGLGHAPTRRQLLEYRVAFATDGVLLVDAEAGAVHEVVFPLPMGRAPTWPTWPAWLAALGGLVAGAALARLLG